MLLPLHACIIIVSTNLVLHIRRRILVLVWPNPRCGYSHLPGKVSLLNHFPVTSSLSAFFEYLETSIALKPIILVHTKVACDSCLQHRFEAWDEHWLICFLRPLTHFSIVAFSSKCLSSFPNNLHNYNFPSIPNLKMQTLVLVSLIEIPGENVYWNVLDSYAFNWRPLSVNVISLNRICTIVELKPDCRCYWCVCVCVCVGTKRNCFVLKKRVVVIVQQN